MVINAEVQACKRDELAKLLEAAACVTFQSTSSLAPMLVWRAVKDAKVDFISAPPVRLHDSDSSRYGTAVFKPSHLLGCESLTVSLGTY